MPERTFTIEWPDGVQENCYSPSSTIDQFIESGQSYNLAEFLQRTTDGLKNASERVRQRYGYHCSNAQGQLQRIQNKSKTFSDNTDAIVKVISIR